MHAKAHINKTKPRTLSYFLFGRQPLITLIVVLYFKRICKPYVGSVPTPTPANKLLLKYFNKLPLHSLPQYPHTKLLGTSSPFSVHHHFLTAIITFILLFTSTGTLFSQNADTTHAVNIEFITNQIEDIAQSTDLNLDYSDLTDQYIYYAKNPININGPNIYILRNLYIINDIQLNNLKLYIKQFGQIYSIYELTSIIGFDEETVKKMQLFIVVAPHKKSNNYTAKEVFKYGHHQLLLRADQLLETKKGFMLPPDSAISNPGSVYLGNPQHYYLRYSFNYNNKFRVGLTMDKDAGEVMFKSSISDSLKQLIGNKISSGYDFLSAYAYAADIGIIKKVIIGDFHLEFGQGLTLWSGLSFGKSAEAVQIAKFGQGIRPNTSANENRFFRGIAATIDWKNLSFTSFYSSNNIDGNIVPLIYNSEDGASSIIETGMHRTINELLDKNSINIVTYGGNINFQKNQFSIGATAFNTLLDKPLLLSNELYKQFNFKGTQGFNYGVNAAYALNTLNFFGEFSGSSFGGFAGIIGANTLISDRFFLTIVYHNYGKEYQNMYSNPFAESSSISNEKGIYFGYKILLQKYISISGYIDNFQFPWLKYRVTSPSTGRDYLTQINFTTSNNISAYFRYRYKNKQENHNVDYLYLPQIGDINRNEYRLFISYSISPNIFLKNRIEMVTYNDDYSTKEYGYLIYQDILFRSHNFPLDASFRYTLFSTDGYNSRIYTYENDVLYAFSVPSYFYHGQRWYLMLKWSISGRITMWARYARTTYFNKNSIGSGNDLIIGNHKSEVKIELKVKF